MTGLFLFYSFYGYGLGPVGTVVPSEVFPSGVRAKAMTVINFIHAFFSAMLVLNFLSTKNALSWPGLFMVFAGFCLITWLLYYIYLPETKGKLLEDMLLHFAELTGDFSVLEAERQLQKERKQ